jgi:medium-chain acyl-[acyl-carrier-protein] hydrolase
MNTISKNAGWIKKYVQPNPQAELRLFCLPYAGGSSQTYRGWASHLSQKIELCPIELPGRGARFSEATITNFPTLVQEIALGIHRYLDKPFAFFGHSMGALLSFELTQLLLQQGYPSPVHLFVSGHRAPHFKSDKTKIHNLPDTEFTEEIRRLGGTPEAVLANVELRNLVFPVLRSDFAAIETYTYQPGRSLSCPITAFGGLQDQGVGVTDLEAWRKYTTGKFRLHMLNGNHFFLHQVQPLILQVVNQQLSDVSKLYESIA